MAGRVISITESLGSGGPAIAKLVGDRLGLTVVDREVFQLAAQEAARGRLALTRKDQVCVDADTDRWGGEA